MRILLRLVASVAFLHALVLSACAREPVAMKIAAPELRGIAAWINSKPLTLKELRGQVVVVHFWAFG